MSGIEVVSLVAGIVAAFSGATSLYRDWLKSREERKNQQDNDKLELVVARGGPDVQDEYDRDFRRLGQAFARGDHIGQNALLQQLVILQQTVISLLSSDGGNASLQHLVHPNHHILMETSSSARSNALAALQQQAQRVLQAAPIQQQPSLPHLAVVPDSKTRRSKTLWEINDRYNCFAPVKFSSRGVIDRVLNIWRFHWSCTKCPWTFSHEVTEELKSCEGVGLNWGCFMQKFHSRWWKRGPFRCFVCKTGEPFNYSEMAEHYRWNHGTSLCNGTCAYAKGTRERIHGDRET